MPHASLLAIVDELVANLANPLRDVRGGAFVGGQEFEALSDVRELDPGDQLHQRSRTEAAAGVDHARVAHLFTLRCDARRGGYAPGPIRMSTPAPPRRRRETW